MITKFNYEFTRVQTALLFGFAIFCFQLFQWTIIAYITPFLFLPLQGLIFLSFLVYIIITTVRLFKKSREKTDFYTSGINLITILAILFFPFNAVSLKIDFITKFDDRVRVVEMVREKNLFPPDTYGHKLVPLSEEMPNVSNGGNEIIVQGTSESFRIFFFTYRGILDNFSGYIYTSEDSPPDHVMGSEPFEVKKIQDHWYFMAFI